MTRHNLRVLEFTETHQIQVGQKTFDSKEMLLYSGHEEENAYGPRIIKASSKTTKEGITMNDTQCYAPINDTNDDV
ncbi:unnamed protein product [Schistosoma curassoni]|uniref:Ovule protein n=1 Tax=Schistosoma curassoni TaxID=6186 RepID=A0A183JGP2_9TREM|nr:unnamed protein product [Schistosoma curassoni]